MKSPYLPAILWMLSFNILVLSGCGSGAVSDTKSAGPVVPALPPGASPSCSHGTALQDGCSGAAAGTPQFPNLLDAYAVRPAWNVAGVDYAVGVPTGTVLKDPTTDSLPSGCSFSGVTVTCSGNNITLQEYDFSLHSTKLSFSGSNNTITKNKFGGTACTDPTIYLKQVGNTAITYNTIDGGGATCTSLVFGAVMFGTYMNGATITRAYNWLKNAPADMTDNAGPSSGSAVIIDHYNLFDTQGWTGHPDGIQLNGGNFSNSYFSFNTYRNPDIGQPLASGTQPVHIEAQLTSVVTNYTVNNNVVLTLGAGWQTANIDIACKKDSGSDTNTGFSAYGNYIDATGAIIAISNGYGCTNATLGSPTPNYNIVTGAVIP